MYIGHIFDAIEKIEGYVRPISREDFLASDLHIDGVARELSIIGEIEGRYPSPGNYAAHPDDGRCEGISESEFKDSMPLLIFQF